MSISQTESSLFLVLSSSIICSLSSLLSSFCHFHRSNPPRHIYCMVSFLFATIYKQAISLIMLSYSAVFPIGAFILPVISCYSISVTSIFLSSLSPLGPHPAPPLVYPVHQTTFPSRSIFNALNCHTTFTFHFLPCLFLLPAAPPLRQKGNSESERVLCAEY